MANELSRLIQDVAEMQRRTAGAVHQGTVDEVKGDKLRVAWGKDPDGNPVKSPWLPTSNHRGGARERRFYKKGQNVTIDTVNGQMDESATVSADAPNEKFKAPDHAEDEREEAETYQLGELHTTKKGDTYEIFLREARFAAHEKGAKLRFGNHFVVVTQDAIIFSAPPVIGGEDPIPNDDG
jgi:hypothetical protein